MRRRITIAVVAVAVAAVLLGGLGTALLSWQQARRTAMAQLRDEAAAMIPFLTLDQAAGSRDQPTIAAASRRIALARQALRLVDASVLVVNENGEVVLGSPPPGTPSDVAISSATHGAMKGASGRLVWASGVSEPGARGKRIVVVLTRQVPLGSGALPWILVSELAAVALAMVAARIVARRLTEPLLAVEAATRRIAAGDLSTRVGAPPQPSDDEVARLARSVDVMAGSLEQARTHERNFLLSVSHDLRTPITSMRGYAEAIADGVTQDPPAAAKVILSESARLERLVADLLDLTRLDAKRFSLHPSNVPIGALVQRSVDGFEQAATKAAITLELADASAGATVLVDPDRFAQVCANLIENALGFASARVRVDLFADNESVRITVSDDGPGIDPVDLPKVFERFHSARKDADGHRSQGSGLGLTISHELVTAMGGELHAAAGPNSQGTTMVLSFPRTSF